MFCYTLVAATLAAPYEPVTPPEVVFTCTTPAFRVPVHLGGPVKPDQVETIRVYVSENRGETWQVYAQLTPDQKSFEYVAARSGEYWFTPAVLCKDGTQHPKDVTREAPQLRVRVAAPRAVFTQPSPVDIPPAPPVSQPTPPRADPLLPQQVPAPWRDPLVSGPTRPVDLADRAAKLEAELTDLQLYLVEAEIRRLRESGRFDEATFERIDELKEAISQLKEQIKNNRKPAGRSPATARPAVPTLSSSYSPLVGPATIPASNEAVPTVPAPVTPR